MDGKTLSRPAEDGVKRGLREKKRNDDCFRTSLENGIVLKQCLPTLILSNLAHF